MKTSARILLAFIATALIYLMAFMLMGCSTTEEIEIDCDIATVTYDGRKADIQIHSESPSIQICRDLPKRRECTTIVAHYYSCVSMELLSGETITFVDQETECQLTIR